MASCKSQKTRVNEENNKRQTASITVGSLFFLKKSISQRILSRVAESVPRPEPILADFILGRNDRTMD